MNQPIIKNYIRLTPSGFQEITIDWANNKCRSIQPESDMWYPLNSTTKELITETQDEFMQKSKLHPDYCFYYLKRGEENHYPPLIS